MITFASERWFDIEKELIPLLAVQWAEIALDKDKIALDPDWARYDALDAMNQLAITTARREGKLVGWYINVVAPHPHYKSTLFAFLDIYYILPDVREGTIGLGLFMEMERQMKERGVREMISIAKTHLDVSPLFERLQWRNTGTTFTKVI